MSSEGFVGCVISIECVEPLGVYQGLVTSVSQEQQTITISKAFRNGKQCVNPQITLSATDICRLDIIKNREEASDMLQLQYYQPKQDDRPSKNDNSAQVAQNGHYNMLAKAQALQSKRSSPLCDAKTPGSSAKVKQSDTLPPEQIAHKDGGFVASQGRKTPISLSSLERHSMRSPVKSFQSGSSKAVNRRRSNSACESTVVVSRSGDARQATTPRRGTESRKQREDCFSQPVDSFTGEFDFEKNLALFDKAAIFEEIESSGNPLYSPPDKKPTKYKCHENVLQSNPTEYEQIALPTSASQHYITDDGLVLPCVTLDLRSRLLDAAEAAGLSRPRQIESVGRSAAEMVVHLVGGSRRLSPQNAHQRPRVVILCGPHHQGAIGMNCGRHLATHGCEVIAFVPKLVKMYEHLEEEVKLFQLTAGVKTSQVKELPVTAVDLIVNALDAHENTLLTGQAWYSNIVRWTNESKAAVLAIDAPSTGRIENKWMLEIVLPLQRKMCLEKTQVYLCDVSLPARVFTDCGVVYKSPFGHRFCIPLHTREKPA